MQKYNIKKRVELNIMLYITLHVPWIPPHTFTISMALLFKHIMFYISSDQCFRMYSKPTCMMDMGLTVK